MKYEFVAVNEHFELQKGISYTSKDLVENSETGLLTINAFHPGGGFKLDSEKPFGGDVKKEYLLRDGDVLLAMTEQDSGLLASPLTVKSDYSKFPNLTFSLDVARVTSKSGRMEPEFLCSVLRIPAFRARAAYGDTGSTVQRLPYEAFGELQIPCPPGDVQRAIVKIINDIDRLIYLNKKLLTTLEQLAHTVFKSWFIDFDPVHAKARIEQPEGMDAETAELFPESFIDSELGQIPIGWQVKEYAELLSITGGKQLAREKFDSRGKNPIFGGAGVMGMTESSNSEGFVITMGRVGAYCGQFFHHQGKAWINNNASLIKAKREDEGEWLLLSLRNFDIESIKKGAAQPFVSNSDLAGALTVIPTPQLINRFSEIARPLFLLAASLEKESLTLSAMRDELLPRLVSGELEIPEELLI